MSGIIGGEHRDRTDGQTDERTVAMKGQLASALPNELLLSKF